MNAPVTALVIAIRDAFQGHAKDGLQLSPVLTVGFINRLNTIIAIAHDLEEEVVLLQAQLENRPSRRLAQVIPFSRPASLFVVGPDNGGDAA